MKRSKWIAGILMMVLLVVTLIGCKSSTTDKGTQGSGNGDNKEEGNSTDNGTEKMGRYVEEEVDLPAPIADGTDSMLNLLLSPEGVLELFAYRKNEDAGGQFVKYILKDDSSWGEITEEWMQSEQWNVDSMMRSAVYGADGKLYITYVITVGEGEDAIWESMVFCITEDGKTAEQVDIPALLKPDQTGYTPMISGVRVLSDGSILMLPSAVPSELKLYGGSGWKNIASYATGANEPIVYNNQLLMLKDDMSAVLILDPMTGDVVKELLVEAEFKSDTCALYSEGGKGIYMADRNGLHFIPESGSKWETLLDGSQCSLSLPTQYLGNLYKTADDEFYVSYSDFTSARSGVLRLRYRTDLPSTSDTVLSIYSLEECKSIRQAMVEFRRLHPEIQVDYRVMIGENSAVTKEDGIKALNTELLSGKGADLIVTDSLPLDSYIEKGVLADISDIILPMKENGQLLHNIVNSNISSDGKIYSMPTRVVLPLLIAKPENLGAAVDLASLSAKIKSGEMSGLFENMDYMEIFHNLYQFYGNDLINEDTLDNAKLAEFLQSFLEIAEKYGVKTEGDDKVYRMPGKGETFFEMESLMDFMFPQVFINMDKMSYGTVNGSYKPKVEVAVNANAAEPQAAKDFIGILLGDSTQSMEVDGMPVNNNGIEELNKMELDISYGTSDAEGEMVQADWLNEEERRILTGKLSELSKPINTDETLINMLTEEIPDLIDGKKSVEEIGTRLGDRLRAYLSE